MRRITLSKSIIWSLAGLVFCSAVMLASCIPIQNEPTPVVDSISTDTPYSTLAPSITHTFTTSPDPHQQPPGYRIETPEFIYSFFDIPLTRVEQKLIVYWREYEDESNYGGYLEYLTFEGERGKLMELTFPTNTWFGIQHYDVSDEPDQYWLDPYIEDGHSLLIHRRDEDGKRYAYLFDLRDQSVLGLSFDLVDDMRCDGWAVGAEYLAWVCSSTESEYINEIFGDYYHYYFFVPRSEPEYVILLTDRVGGFSQEDFSWQEGEFWITSYNSELICHFNVEDCRVSCDEFTEDTYVQGFISPDRQWIETQPGVSYPQEIALVPLSCVEDPDLPCEPTKRFSIAEFMNNWQQDCRGILFGAWAPDSQRLFWITIHEAGPAGELPCSAKTEKQELWEYNLLTETLRMVGEYPVKEIDGGIGHTYVNTYAPTIWSPDEKKLLMLHGSPGIKIAYYLISVDDGELTYLGDLPGQHLGSIELLEN